MGGTTLLEIFRRIAIRRPWNRDAEFRRRSVG